MTNEVSTLPNYIFDKLTGWRLNLPTHIEPGSRVLALYRVSTDKQLYHTEENDADIPMQRIRCREFCERMGWTLVCELQEEGVSGHKVRAEQRDKIQLIKEYTKEKKFDILLVFMFDRIGRISDETPFVVEWLISNGIHVWSALEGEQRIENHTDRLTNYIRYWQADGESQKISARTSNSMVVLTEAGHFTGGLCAYGYCYARLGRTNRRKQEVYDLEICEEEAYIVKTIFRLAADEGYGAHRLANYLNRKGIKNRSGKNWHPASIQGMLRNILYTGILRSGKSRSETQEQLRIIDDKTFDTVQKMLEIRSRERQAVRSAPLSTRGNALLSGNIFCGHCGARLCITTSGRNRRLADGSRGIRTRYTCQTKSRTHGDCDGQTGYTVEKLDAIIDSVIHGIFSRVCHLSKSDVLDACCNQELAEKKAILKKLEKDLSRAESDLSRLKTEITKALTGESAFSPQLLNEVIQNQEQRCSELRSKVCEAQAEWENEEAAMASIGEHYDELLKWSTVYDTASISAKKTIVSHIIDRVDVRRDYQLKIKLNISIEQFLVSLKGVNTNETPPA